MRSLVVDDDAAVRQAALDWCREYLARDHAGVGRDGAVCPFVESAMRAGTLVVEIRRTGPVLAPAAVDALIRDMIATFQARHWPHRNRLLHALVTVLPELDRRHALALDDAQAAVKRELAEAGLMLGQFHQDCAEPAARNPSFPVSQAPIPMLALRHMALHDVLFLADDPDCFAAYRNRFGDRYRDGAVPDPYFVQLYRQAAARFGDE
ncbi:DUF6875 domain-containing protein [Micromonospora zingiberis]|uniref:DUF6875 domain-containing protein n=1 Tax=Micromonospora zingiberis TaxID=2053011 RepID=UPI0013F3CA62|nr:hypothetical protein [Micromonospora zingiberis]